MVLCKRFFQLISTSLIVIMGSMVGANSATLDFTERSYIGSNGNVAGTTYSITSVGGTLTWAQNLESNTCFGLACIKDGLGVGDDEITIGNEKIIVDFGTNVRITGLSFLDLFSSVNGRNREKAIVAYNGTTLMFDALISQTPGGTSGFLTSGALNIITSQLVFTAGGTNDNLGSDDYALAAINVSAVPLPPALLMFGAALGGIGMLRRRKLKS